MQMHYWKLGETLACSHFALRFWIYVVLSYCKYYNVIEKTYACMYDVFNGETVIEEMLLSQNRLEIYSLGGFVEVILT